MNVLVIGFLLLFAPLNTSFGQNQKILQNSDEVEKIIRTSDGVDLLVRIKGNGPFCLFVHGGPGTGCHWVEKISDGLLERHFRMVYLDQRGAERSGNPADGNYSLERMIQDFEEVRRHLGIERWLTMGHSFGGIMQTAYARRHPDVQRGQIMLNCTLNMERSFTESWIPKACEFLGVTDPMKYFGGEAATMGRINKLIKALRELGIFWKMTYASPESEDAINATSGDIPNRNREAQKALLECSDYWKDFKPAMAEIDVPALFFYGAQDWMAGPLHYRGVNFPNMMLWESDVGHVPFLENKADLEKAIDSYRKKYAL
ncbi:MAG: alpha/beta fold hydrolase [Candidatus Latescibacterota bacterium]